MAVCEKGYHGTLIAEQEFGEKIVKANIEDEEQFMKELQDYLKINDAIGNFVTFNYVFRQVLQRNAEYRGLSENDLLKRIKEKCASINDEKDRKKIRNRIHGFLKESKSKPNRQCVIEVAVVLELTIEDLNTLLQKGLFQTAVCYSSYKELVGVYCIQNKYSYNDYIYIINQYENDLYIVNAEKQNTDKGEESEREKTQGDSILFQKEVNKLILTDETPKKDEFLNYLLRMSGSFKGYSRHTLNEFYALFEEVRFTASNSNVESIDINNVDARSNLYTYLAESICHGERKTINKLVRDLRKRVDDNINSQLDELDKQRVSGEVKDYKKISYAEIKAEFKRIYSEHKSDLADDVEFNTLLDAAFPCVTSDENVIRILYGGTYEDGGLMQNDGRYGIEIQDADLPKQVLNAPISKDRYNYIRNMVKDYREFNSLVENRRKSNPELTYREICKKCPEIKKMEGRLRIPQRHEFLMLIYFLFKHTQRDEKIANMNLAKEFKYFSSSILKRAGYFPIYEGNLLDVMLMGCLVKPQMELTYHRFIRYALAPEEEW